MRKSIIRVNYLKLVSTSIVVSLIVCLLADSLKKLTEFFEEHVFHFSSEHRWLFIVLPSVGITIIYFLRKYVFKGRSNKGIKEIYQTIDNRRDELPLFKIPSHFFNGFLTVISGGSTGIEVSTVVASAAVGASAYKKDAVANVFKTELICAGVTAGVAILFGNPFAGILFSLEVISGKASKTLLLSNLCAALVASIYIFFAHSPPLFSYTVSEWHTSAFPYFILLSLLAAVAAVYFTRSVLFIKKRFFAIKSNFWRVNIGALLVGTAIYFFPQLFGDSYHAIPELMTSIGSGHYSSGLVLLLIALVILKPLVASLTLGAGGDGGVFAPSIVLGAVLGMLVAVLGNHIFDAHLIVFNFALVGAAAALSAAIHAPLTALVLVCGLVPGGYILFLPVMIGSFLAKYSAKYIFKYTVYSYKENTAAHTNIRS